MDSMPTALITGGTADGWRVVVPFVAGGGRERLPEGTESVEADLTDPDEVARAVRLATSESDAPLRAVANLVGGFAADQPIADTPVTDFEAMFQLNLRPTYLVSQCAIPHLRDGGAMVCVASRAALEPFAGAAGYAASKAAVIAFAKVVAKEGVRCNVIVPSMIDTPANRAASPDAIGRMVPPERIARVIRFLCDDSSAAINGAVIPV
jgi:NAD(P)-dependent dehydrogenase (short-subunit alcohol dehydrogenase family)